MASLLSVESLCSLTGGVFVQTGLWMCCISSSLFVFFNYLYSVRVYPQPANKPNVATCSLALHQEWGGNQKGKSWETCGLR